MKMYTHDPSIADDEYESTPLKSEEKPRKEKERAMYIVYVYVIAACVIIPSAVYNLQSSCSTQLVVVKLIVVDCNTKTSEVQLYNLTSKQGLLQAICEMRS